MDDFTDLIRELISGSPQGIVELAIIAAVTLWFQPFKGFSEEPKSIQLAILVPGAIIIVCALIAFLSDDFSIQENIARGLAYFIPIVVVIELLVFMFAYILSDDEQKDPIERQIEKALTKHEPK